ncbi:phosphoribosylformylglycinamidine synthase subunit PurQ, partial [Klebsiella pneumoniae]|uniref:phosphoribosylformylglycinamidine synthase subunit PurQ n=1 Tax=Klebsiella pneumoniae TaxID=573 RepID=UPI003075C551
FVRNRSERFEARFSLVKVTESPSLMLQDMVVSQMTIAVSHGEGFAESRNAEQLSQLEAQNLVGLRVVDHYGNPTEQY